MSKLRVFLTLTGYQITWLTCVFSEIKFNDPLLGIYVGLTYLLLYFYFSKNKIKLIKISLLISIPGYLFDTMMIFLSVYEFNSTLYLGILPLWMTVLWLSFSTLFDEILQFFKKYKILGIILSGVLAPLTYYLGYPIGIISINNVTIFFVAMITFWVLLMIYYLEILLKDN